MRARNLVLLAFVSAACAGPPSPADPRQPVALYVRTGEFLRAEYVDSAWAASPDPQPEARARALEVWRQYGAPGLDSLVLHVSDRAGVEPGSPTMYTRFFRFTSAELGGAPGTAASAGASPSRPVALGIRPGDHVRAEFVDSSLVAAASIQDHREELMPLARRVWGEHGAPLDSVTIAVSNYVDPAWGTLRTTRQPRRTITSQFTAAELKQR